MFRPHRASRVRVRPEVWAALLVAAIAVVTYAGTLRYEFVWDDQTLIVQNPGVRSWSALGDNVSGDFFESSQNPEVDGKRGYYRPLVTLSYMLDYSAWGLNPTGFHLTNVAAHAVASALVVLVLAPLVAVPTALVAGAVFAVHPAHVESVAWISGRTDVLATLFCLLAFGAYQRTRPDASDGNLRWGWAMLAVGSFALAVLSKEVAVVLPLVLAAYEWALAPERARDWRAVAWRLAPFLVTAAAYGTLRAIALSNTVLPSDPVLSMAGRTAIALTFVKALGLYALTLLWPVSLSAYYSVTLERSLLAPGVLASAVALGLAGLAAWRARARQPLWLFALFWFVIALVPVSNLVPIGAPPDMEFLLADRFLYLPSVGFCLGVALVLKAFTRLLPLDAANATRTLYVAALPLILVACVLTVARSDVWRTELGLYTATLEQNPRSALLHFNLGLEYLERGDPVRAERAFRSSARWAPQNSRAYTNVGVILFERGDVAGAAESWRRAVAAQPRDYNAWYNLAIALDDMGDAKGASGAYGRFLAAAPATSSYHEHRARAEQRLHALQGSETPRPAPSH